MSVYREIAIDYTDAKDTYLYGSKTSDCVNFSCGNDLLTFNSVDVLKMALEAAEGNMPHNLGKAEADTIIKYLEDNQ